MFKITKTQMVLGTLDQSCRRLQRIKSNYKSIDKHIRTLERIKRIIERPMRVAILGETNSGKSSVANLLVGAEVLPSLPVANTRWPTWLRYAKTPTIFAVCVDGAKWPLTTSQPLPDRAISYLEVGLPSKRLLTMEIIDPPGSSNALLPFDVSMLSGMPIDATIWTTPATQAWRETERAFWARLPERLRRRSILAVTFSDCITNAESKDRLLARLKPIIQSQFSAMCLVSGARKKSEIGGLLAALDSLSEAWAAARLERSLALTRRVAEKALRRLEHDTSISDG